MSLLRPNWLVIVAVAAGLACGDDGGGPGPAPAEMAIDGGNNQVAPAGTALPSPLLVFVTDEDGRPVSNVAISWAVGTGGGSVGAATSTTDFEGVTSMTRTLGPNAGTHTTIASRDGLTGSPLTFTSIAQVQGATQIAKSAGDEQTDTVLATLDPYSVIVRNQTSAPVPGVNVTWAASEGGRVNGAGSVVTVTNASGIASATHKLNETAGTQTVTAAVAGLVGSPIIFSATALPGNATQIDVADGNHQLGQINTTLAAPYRVGALDAYGNPKPGVAVEWAVHAGTGALSPLLSTTGSTGAALGIAASTRTLGAAAGTYTDTATAAGLAGSPLLFTVRATVEPAAAAVSVQNNSFNPDSVLIAVGGSVTWTWVAASNPHNVVFSSGAAPSNCATQSSGSCTRLFANAGTFDYECLIHPGMTGKVAVAP